MKYIQPKWPAPLNIRACTTVRETWGGRQNNHEINKDESQQIEKLLTLPAKPIWITQTHSTTVIKASIDNLEAKADGSYTTEPNTVCVVLTADCLPVLICNKQGTAIAAVHAGWRGLANGILETAVSELKQNPEDLLVWLGPAIGPNYFEVGKDVYDAFTSIHPEAESGFTPHQKDKWMANLYLLATHRLKKLGISNTYGGEYCTYTQADLFFSYRRDKGKTGRMASLIWIQPN